ncbi:MAG TPA: winged helix-turn-helix domain-containing protein, partial [Pyrinomonadaceae bacterium]
MSRQSKEEYEFGDFRLDVLERKLERLNGRKTDGSLPEKAFQTLVHLVRNAGTLVSKDELLATIWRDTIVEENNIGKAIHAIRHCLGDRSGEQKYIETVPKHGYRFVADVKRFVSDNGLSAGNVLPSGKESAPLRKTSIRSPAWDLYVRGKVKAGSETREDAEAAIKVLEAAVEIDPELSGVYAQLARAYN